MRRCSFNDSPTKFWQIKDYWSSSLSGTYQGNRILSNSVAMVRTGLVTFSNINQPGIIFSPFKPQGQEFFQHHGNFHAVGCGK